tara:strand:+ start:94 stop:279 length:186 start_codon:yes stop_codon:yes gene_type:complete
MNDAQYTTLECLWINKELDRMDRELDGCDWCCGGGDERAEYLFSRLKKLGGKRERLDPEHM